MSRRSLLLALAAPALVGVYASCGEPLPSDDSADGSAEGSAAEGGAPDGGAPEAAPLATGLYAPLYIKEDGVNVFVSSVDGGVYKIRKDGTSGAQPLGNGSAWGLTTGDNYVFFCRQDQPAIERVDKDTGQQIEIAPATPGCLELAKSDDGFVYYTTGRNGGVSRVPKDGDAGLLLYEAMANEGPEGIAVDDSSVYFADLEGAHVHAIDHDGGNHRIVGRGLQPRKVALDDDYVYWVDYDSNTVKRAPKAGSEPDGGGAVIGSGPGKTGKGGLAVDDRYVYWIVSQPTEGTLNRAPKDGGGASSVLVDHLDDPVDVAVDSDFIYFTQEIPGRVMRLEKR